MTNQSDELQTRKLGLEKVINSVWTRTKTSEPLLQAIDAYYAAIIHRERQEARIEELTNALLAEPKRQDADFASQMLAVVTHTKDRLAELKQSQKEGK